jgi:hypothetical protein
LVPLLIVKECFVVILSAGKLDSSSARNNSSWRKLIMSDFPFDCTTDPVETAVSQALPGFKMALINAHYRNFWHGGFYANLRMKRL